MKKSVNVVLYTRVAQIEQDKTKSELNKQEESLLKYCQLNGYNVLGIFRDECSGNKFDRPAWIKLNEFIKTNSGKVNKIVCTTWSRFSRNITLAVAEIERLKSIGVEVSSSEQHLDFTNKDSKMILSIYMCVSGPKLNRNQKNRKHGAIKY
jgi:DNA invertase Pin-like site-specific DNA recombinase